MKYWEIMADNLSKAGWTWGCVATVDREGRTIWIANAHRGDGKRFVVHADEKPTAFMELEFTDSGCQCVNQKHDSHRFKVRGSNPRVMFI
jgi:hypothetical protein